MAQQRVAVVTGVTGQDGSIISDQLLGKGYKVYGLVRRGSDSPNLKCSAHLANEPDFVVVEGDITDLSSLVHLCNKSRPDRFFNCAAMSHVGDSFREPIHSIHVTGVGVLNCLEAIRLSGYHTRFLQCSSSEMYGGMTDDPQNEFSVFHPRSPYGCAKMYGYWITVNYRESYKMFACNSICFNHEQPGKRGPDFVTRKISIGAVRIKLGLQDKLFLGNLDARRDWGMAEDYTKGFQLILEASEPDDYVLATGETHSVREFCNLAFRHLDLDYRNYVEVNPEFYRPAEVHTLIGDASKARRILGWEPKVGFEELVARMVDHDMNLLQQK